MQNTRLLLRVAAKIMLLLSLIFIFWIFIAGFLPDDVSDETLVVDVSGIAVGQAAYFKPGRRKILVVHKSDNEQLPLEQRFLVIYAQDSFYGCEVMLDVSSKLLRAQCADVQYDLDGRLIKGTRNHEDLKSPEYHWLGPQNLQIGVD